MPLLPQPDTLSSGALQLLYRVGAIDHVTSTNMLDSVSFSDIAVWRAEAMAFADEVQSLLTSISVINAWRLVNPAGVSIYEEDFAVPYNGTRSPSTGEVASQSASGSLTGKGTPPIGYAQGQTRVTVFLGSFDTVEWPDAHQVLDAGTIDWNGLRDFLTASVLVGADHYGTKCTFRNYFCPQINSHYQKKYGL
jgi:hypothetical protein